MCVFPTKKDHSSIIKIRKFTLIQSHHLILRTHLYFANCCKIVLYRRKINVNHAAFSYVSSVSFILKQFLSLSLTLMILILLKIIGQLFCRVSLNLGLSLLLRNKFWWCYIHLTVFYQVALDFNSCHYLDEVDFGHLIMVCQASQLTKLLFYPLYFMER